MTDTYSAPDAARVLGCSERLVRKYAADGRVTVVQEHPLRVSQESVHRVRAERKASTRASKPVAAQGITLDAAELQALVQSAVAAAIQQTVHLMLESRDAVESRLAADLAQARQEIDRLRADLDAGKSGGRKKAKKRGGKRKRKR